MNLLEILVTVGIILLAMIFMQVRTLPRELKVYVPPPQGELDFAPGKKDDRDMWGNEE